MERFWSKVHKDPDGCWEWTASRDAHGYGQFRMDGKVLRAHRVSFTLTHGQEPLGVLMHSCDNPSCVRPEHLRDGTQSENIKDSLSKGRFQQLGYRAPRAPKTHCQRGHEFTKDNTYVTPDGRRQCKTCKRARS